MIGVHLEGPFIEKSKAGAQPLEYIIEPNIEQFKRWQTLSGNQIKTITIAPEHDETGAFIRYLNESGVKDRKSTRLNSSHVAISYAVFCLKKKKDNTETQEQA